MDVLQDIIRTLSLPDFYFAMFRSATPVLLTTLGAMVASRAGTNNIALEGTMLISAFVGILAIIHVVVAINWAVYKAYRFIHERKKKRLKNKARPVREQVRMLEPHE